MLDLYLLDDSLPKPNRPIELNHIGGIEEKLFLQLQAEGIIEPWFDYYRDFRWGSEIVNRMLLKLPQKSAALQSPKQTNFIAILQKAVAAKSGLMAYAD
ncbi:hypothetical protein [Hymenobacter cellulosivorans]|uniref:DUF262 domain-containing protein n=1 Tax=Hymenobacter cellulosivorans TaxID=2932249 RepID=A0ABY4F5B2_9BACT|nr:hypothetical protein [Hymenobacter cellulosivorans]UOQ51862.1 hypothetical protein MUN80_19120 [Hymenobacter cellulosivorans]